MKNLKYTDTEIKTIFNSIHLGVGGHGSFLTTLASLTMRADADNFKLLKPVLCEMIDKYNLNTDTYLFTITPVV